MTKIRLPLAPLLAVLPLACAPVDDAAPPSVAAEPAAAPTNRVAIPPSVRGNLGITFAEVEVRPVARTLRIPGAFELEPRARREYRMGLPGRVQLLVDQYEAVTEGQALFRFRSPAWPELLHEIVESEQEIEVARAEIAVAHARLQGARAGLERADRRLAALAEAEFKEADLEVEAAGLAAELPLLQAELVLAETRLANAHRKREHALHRAATSTGLTEETLEEPVPTSAGSAPRYTTLEWIEVRAEAAGVVEELAVTDGAFLEPPALVLSTVDPQRVRLRALALQADLDRLEDATRARIVPSRGSGRALDASVPARVTLGLEAQPEDRIMSVLAQPEEHAPWIRAGFSAFLEVVVDDSGGPALAVPRAAIVRDGLQHVLFRRDPADPDQAIRVEADLGIDDGRWVVLRSGVMRGDQVVVDGAYELELASASGGRTPEGGHFHADGSFHDNH